MSKAGVDNADYNEFSEKIGKTNGNGKCWSWYTHEISKPYFSGCFLKLRGISPPEVEKKKG